jgi:hypothetical protein
MLTIKQRLQAALERRGWTVEKNTARYLVMRPPMPKPGEIQVSFTSQSRRMYLGVSGALRTSRDGKVTTCVPVREDYKNTLLTSID